MRFSQLFEGGFCNFPIAISPRPSNETNETRARAKKKIDKESRADLLTTHREINSPARERKREDVHTYPAILPMRMQRNSSFGRRDDETGRPERNLSFFRTFLRWFSKNYTQDTTTLDSRNSRRRESTSRPRRISRDLVSLLASSFF